MPWHFLPSKQAKIAGGRKELPSEGRGLQIAGSWHALCCAFGKGKHNASPAIEKPNQMRTHAIHKQAPLMIIEKPTINPTKLAKLHYYFGKLDSDLEIGLAVALSYKFNCSCPDIFAAYEAWQVSDWNEED